MHRRQTGNVSAGMFAQFCMPSVAVLAGSVVDCAPMADFKRGRADDSARISRETDVERQIAEALRMVQTSGGGALACRVRRLIEGAPEKK